MVTSDRDRRPALGLGERVDDVEVADVLRVS